MRFQIEHLTRYTYSDAVALGTHRLMLRPDEREGLRVDRFEITCSPGALLTWTKDEHGNAVALAEFAAPAEELVIRSVVEGERPPFNPFALTLPPAAERLPFQYPKGMATKLRPYLGTPRKPVHPHVSEWLRVFLDSNGGANTFDCLAAIARCMPLYLTYRRREEPGVQAPEETLRLRSGSCRDFAALFLAGARSLGLAARFVSGYLISHAHTTAAEQAAAGATHAWVEVFLPGVGWRGFDPTCGLLETEYHIGVAAVPQATEAPPVSGTYRGDASLATGLQVEVVTRVLN
jgi:transglutaminase-like putative cysteine protease